jgi:hypothetical protein
MGSDENCSSDSTLLQGGEADEEMAPALGLMLILTPRSAGANAPWMMRASANSTKGDGKGFQIVIGEGAFNVLRKSSSHLPLPRLIRSMRPVIRYVPRRHIIAV